MGYSSFQIGYVIFEYGLFNTTTFIQNLIYIRFGIILTEFYINFSTQEHQLDVLYVLFKTWDSQVSAYTPFHFSFTVPLKAKFWGPMAFFNRFASCDFLIPAKHLFPHWTFQPFTDPGCCPESLLDSLFYNVYIFTLHKYYLKNKKKNMFKFLCDKSHFLNHGGPNSTRGGGPCGHEPRDILFEPR